MRWSRTLTNHFLTVKVLITIRRPSRSDSPISTPRLVRLGKPVRKLANPIHATELCSTRTQSSSQPTKATTPKNKARLCQTKSQQRSPASIKLWGKSLSVEAFLVAENHNNRTTNSWPRCLYSRKRWKSFGLGFRIILSRQSWTRCASR